MPYTRFWEFFRVFYIRGAKIAHTGSLEVWKGVAILGGTAKGNFEKLCYGKYP